MTEDKSVPLEFILPPFGHAMTIPVDTLNHTALKWVQDNCVIVTREEWDRVRDLARGVGGGQEKT
jgi:hypothetical protein